MRVALTSAGCVYVQKAKATTATTSIRDYVNDSDNDYANDKN